MVMQALARYGVPAGTLMGGVFVGPTAAIAAEDAGMPQLNADTFASQIVWLIITFAVLYVLLARKALPRIAEVLEERQDRIDHDLDQAERTRQRAEEVWQAYEQTLAEARGQANAVIDQAKHDIAERQAERERQFAAEMQKRTEEAEKRIAQAKSEALDNIRTVAVETSQAAAGRLAGLEIDSQKAEDAVDRAMRS